MNPTFACMVTMSTLTGDTVGTCPACQGEDWLKTGQVKDYSITGEWFDLIMCNICGLKVTIPQPSKTAIGRYYASDEYISHSDTKTGLINRLYHFARKYMLNKKNQWVTTSAGMSQGTLLDIGAGTGHFAHYMKTQGWNVTALEPDDTARKVAKEKLGLTILPLDELEYLKATSFDVITLWHVLEHVHDLTDYMDKFRLLLKPGGTLIIAVPNHLSKDAVHYGAHWAAYDVPRHLWHFSPMSMEKLLGHHQFSLEKKMSMPLDAFYVSMLSEKYKGNTFWGAVAAFISGTRTFFAANSQVNKASSVIYVAR